jgi:hypothetical protein
LILDNSARGSSRLETVPVEAQYARPNYDTLARCMQLSLEKIKTKSGRGEQNAGG